MIGCLTLVLGQVSLKRYDDPTKHGYESVVFEKVVGKNADGSEIKEKVKYELAIHNPYHLDTDQSTQLSPNKASTLFNVSIEEVGTSDVLTDTHRWITISENYAVVSYNLWGYNDHGEDTGVMRKSTIKVINNNGEEIYSQEINSDSYSVQVTPNGRFLTYAFGEPTADSSPAESGVKIIEIESQTEFYSINGIVDYIGYGFDYLVIGISQNGKDYTWILDTDTKELFQLTGVFIMPSSNQFRSSDGSIIIEDLAPYKIK
ncbi:MAG: hypothetical protein AAGA66_11805 [Bacteroidota bacterium]